MSNGSSLLQKTYIQKSVLFLLPLTGVIKHKTFKYPSTYIKSPDLTSSEYPKGISIYDQILILTYPKSYKEKDDELYNKIIAKLMESTDDDYIPTAWEKFETEVLFSNKNFIAFHQTDDEFIYTFDLSNWSEDWKNFLKGKYSMFSEKAKETIIKYRWKSLAQIEQKKLYCYVHPEKEECLEAFANELKVELPQLMEVRELCSKPNFKLETYTCKLKEKADEVEG